MFEAIRSELESEYNMLGVKELCSLAGVSRSGYYRYISEDGAQKRYARELKDREDFALIKVAYDFRGYAKGYRSICMRLARMGTPMNHKKVRRLMNKYGLRCPIRKANPYRRMAKAIKTNVVAPNLVDRQFKTKGPRQVLLTDITYIRLQKNFCYLSVIIDAFTMQVLSFVLSESLEVDFVLETVEILIKNHLFSLDATTIIHSDQGCHYTSVKFRELIKDTNLRQSMSRRGNCWDNAPQESFFGHMKDELAPYIPLWESFDDVKYRITDWMDYYNNDRYQAQLKGMAPNEYYHYIVTNILPTTLT
ncbi:IS3 family transposase [Pseudobutyrivibrio sp.]|uniref:IS3 family transposase n=1 Tax=Pseudobutyrivibrio sp. TaxID=2014367 RepID=UPI00386F61B1